MRARPLATVLLACLGACPATAGTIVDEWASVRVPSPPELRPVTLDPKTTVLLLLDFNGGEDAASGPCNAATKLRCLLTVPKVRALADAARAHGVPLIYSTSAAGTPADIRADLAPMPGEPVVRSGPDKFVGTDLRGLLAERGAETVVVTGTAAEGAVLDTATDAALHGMRVVVPVDGMSSTEPYAEQYVVWHFAHAPGVSTKTVLTRIDAIGF